MPKQYNVKMSKNRRFLSISRSNNGWDQFVCKCGEKGLTAEATARKTNLSVSQVYTRWRKYGISPLDYRLGLGREATLFLRDLRKNIINYRAPQNTVWWKL